MEDVGYHFEGDKRIKGNYVEKIQVLITKGKNDEGRLML